jgi:hypothetical protein
MLADGARVHFDDRLACVFRYGERWRGEATTSLTELGIAPPIEFKN